MPCLICGAIPTVKSHILPRAFFHAVRAGEPHALTGSSRRNGAEIRQSGLWDRNILCDNHEKHLGSADDYAVDFCRSFTDKAESIADGKGFLVPNPRPELLTRFVMSVIWRYAVSVHGKREGVRLGPYEARLRALIFDPDCPFPEPDILVARHEWQLDGRTIPLTQHPSSGRFDSRVYWQFNTSSFDFRMKLDQRPDGLPRALLANGADPLTLYKYGPDDVRSAHQAIFTRMSAGKLDLPWLHKETVEQWRRGHGL